MDHITPPQFIALKPDNRQRLGREVDTSVIRPAATKTSPFLETFKPLAEKFWYIPWIILGVITWRWIKKRLP